MFEGFFEKFIFIFTKLESYKIITNEWYFSNDYLEILREITVNLIYFFKIFHIFLFCLILSKRSRSTLYLKFIVFQNLLKNDEHAQLLTPFIYPPNMILSTGRST
jgi:hypothetical protein